MLRLEPTRTMAASMSSTAMRPCRFGIAVKRGVERLSAIICRIVTSAWLEFQTLLFHLVEMLSWSSMVDV